MQFFSERELKSQEVTDTKSKHTAKQVQGNQEIPENKQDGD